MHFVLFMAVKTSPCSSVRGSLFLSPAAKCICKHQKQQKSCCKRSSWLHCGNQSCSLLFFFYTTFLFVFCVILPFWNKTMGHQMLSSVKIIYKLYSDFLVLFSVSLFLNIEQITFSSSLSLYGNEVQCNTLCDCGRLSKPMLFLSSF